MPANTETLAKRERNRNLAGRYAGGLLTLEEACAWLIKNRRGLIDGRIQIFVYTKVEAFDDLPGDDIEVLREREGVRITRKKSSVRGAPTVSIEARLVEEIE